MPFGNCGVLRHVGKIPGSSVTGVWRTRDGLREAGSGPVVRRGSLTGPSVSSLGATTAVQSGSHPSVTGQRGSDKATGMFVTRDTWLEVAFALQLSLGSVGLAGGHLAASGQCSWASPVAQLVKNLPAMWETWVGRPQFTAWVGKIPWRRERLPLQYSGLENSMDYIVHGSQRVRHNCTNLGKMHKYSVSLEIVISFSMT